MTEDEIDQAALQAANQSTLQALTPQYDNQDGYMDDAALQAANAVADTPPNQQKPPEQFNLSASVSHWLSDGIDYAQDKFAAGREDLSNTLTWVEAAAERISDEEAMERTSDERMQKLRQAKIDPMEQTLWWTDPRRIIGEVSQMAPYAGALLAGTATTAVGAGTIGLIGGPPTALTAAGLAAPGGAFVTASILGNGSMYGQLRRQGVEKKAAQQFAANYGAFSGALNAFRFMGTKNALQKSFESELAKGATKLGTKIAQTGAAGRAFQKQFEAMVQENARMGARRLMKELGMTQILPAEIDEVGKIITEWWANPKFNDLTKHENQVKVMNRMMEAFKTSLIAGAGFLGGAHISGWGTGKFSAALKQFGKEVEKTIDEIKHEERDKLLNKIEQEENPSGEINKVSVTPEQRIDRATKKSEDIRARIELLEGYVKDDIANGVPTEDLQKTLTGLRRELKQVRKEKREAQFDAAKEEIDRILSDFESEYSIEEKETQLQEIRRVKGLATNLVRKSSLDKDMKADFIALIGRIDTVDAFAAPSKKGGLGYQLRYRLQAALDKQARNDAFQTLREQIGRKVYEKAGAKRKSLIGFTEQMALEKYKEYIGDELSKEPKKAQEVIDKHLERLEKEAENADAGKVFGLDPDIDARIAGEVLGLKNKTPEQVHKLAESIGNLIDKGLDSELAKKAAEQGRRERLKASVIEKANGNRPIYKEKTINGEKVTVKEPESNFKRALRSFGHTISTWDHFMKNVFQDSPDHEAHLLMDIHNEVMAHEANVKYWYARAADIITGGDKKLRNYLDEIHQDAFKNDSKLSKLVFTDQNGVQRNLGSLTKDGVLSRSTAIQMYLSMRNPERWAGLSHGNGITFKFKTPEENAKLNGANADGAPRILDSEKSAQAVLEGALKEEDFQIAKGISEFWNNSEYFDRIQENHIDEYSMPLKPHDVYEGSLYRDMDKPDAEGSYLDINREFMPRRSNVPKSLIETKRSKEAYRFAPITHSMQKQISKLEWWMAARKKYKDMLYVLKDKEFREIVETKFTGKFLAAMDGAFDSIMLQRGKSIAQQFDLAAAYNRNSASAFTIGKIPNAIAQISGIVNIFQELGAVDGSVGIASFFANPFHAVKTLKNTNYMKNRWRMIDTALHDAEVHKFQSKFTGNKIGMVDFFALPMRMVDAAVNFIGGWSVYASAYDKTLTKGGSKAAAHEAGINHFERTMNRTQGSGSADQITNFERGGDIQKGVMVFFKQPIQAFQYQTIAFKEWVSNPTVQNAERFARVYLAAHAAQALFEMIKSTPDLTSADVEEDIKDRRVVKIGREFVKGPQPPPLSQFFDLATIPFTNKILGVDEKPFDAVLPFLSSGTALKNLSQLVINIQKQGDMTLEDLGKGIEEIGRLTPFFTPLPVSEGGRQLRKSTKGTSQTNVDAATIGGGK